MDLDCFGPARLEFLPEQPADEHDGSQAKQNPSARKKPARGFLGVIEEGADAAYAGLRGLHGLGRLQRHIDDPGQERQ